MTLMITRLKQCIEFVELLITMFRNYNTVEFKIFFVNYKSYTNTHRTLYFYVLIFFPSIFQNVL